jgi:hypothetical protein
MHIQGAILLMLFILAACGDGTNNTQPPAPETATVLAANDLGMHCMDREFSVFSILPPFNVVNAQVVKRDSNGQPYVADDSELALFYDDVADASGSINSYSVGKTDFWSYANALFDVTLPVGQGLTELYMPADDPQVRGSQLMEYSLNKEMFSAEGIPITPTDDTLIDRPYPLLPVSSRQYYPAPARCHENGRHGLQRLPWRHAGRRR